MAENPGAIHAPGLLFLYAAIPFFAQAIAISFIYVQNTLFLLAKFSLRVAFKPFFCVFFKLGLRAILYPFCVQPAEAI